MRRAAIRRTKFELGINDLTISDLHVASRILYYAVACEKFAEYELDYIIFAKKDVEVNYNEDEVMGIKYVSLENLESFIDERKRLYNEDITPWFRILLENKLKDWWYNLKEYSVMPKEAHYVEKFI